LRRGSEAPKRSIRSECLHTAKGRMVKETVELDRHRGIAAQKATDLRRLVREVADDRARLKARQETLERFLVAAPAATWKEAAEKMRYLLGLFAATSEAQDPRRKTLVANLLTDIERLLTRSDDDHAATPPADGE
jgi:hypothetical protein